MKLRLGTAASLASALEVLGCAFDDLRLDPMAHVDPLFRLLCVFFVCHHQVFREAGSSFLRLEFLATYYAQDSRRGGKTLQAMGDALLLYLYSHRVRSWCV